jgi:hypothetical protein
MKKFKIIFIILLRVKQLFSVPRETKVHIVYISFSTKNDRL